MNEVLRSQPVTRAEFDALAAVVDRLIPVVRRLAGEGSSTVVNMMREFDDMVGVGAAPEAEQQRSIGATHMRDTLPVWQRAKVGDRVRLTNSRHAEIISETKTPGRKWYCRFDDLVETWPFNSDIVSIVRIESPPDPDRPIEGSAPLPQPSQGVRDQAEALIRDLMEKGAAPHLIARRAADAGLLATDAPKAESSLVVRDRVAVALRRNLGLAEGDAEFGAGRLAECGLLAGPLRISMEQCEQLRSAYHSAWSSRCVAGKASDADSVEAMAEALRRVIPGIQIDGRQVSAIDEEAFRSQWNPISTAPKRVMDGNGGLKRFRAKMADGTIHDDVHWASDLSGEEQPPFEGYFVPSRGGTGFYQIAEPVEWQEIRP